MLAPNEMKNSSETKRLALTGEGISPGIAQGRAFLYTDILTRDLQIRSIEKSDIGKEKDRLHSALQHVSEDLDVLKEKIRRESDNKNAAIFDFHKEVLKDKQLNLDLEEALMKELINVEIVVKNVFRKLSDRLRSSGNEVISAKADDIEDLSKKILHVLLGYEWNILENLPPDSIVVAKRLLPSDTIHLKRESLRGLIVEEGSVHSHSALLAREFGITAVAGIKDPHTLIRNGDKILLDGQKGTVIIHPTAEDIQEHQKKNKYFGLQEQKDSEKVSEPAVTQCGQQIKIYANAYSENDFETAYGYGCDGIGLVRLEQIYMSFASMPDENDIVTALEPHLKKYAHKIVTIRLLDIGGDKRLPYLKIGEQDALGLRGIRLLLKNIPILKMQLRAVLRLSLSFPVRLLVPMITLPEELIAVRKILKQCKEELASDQMKFPDIPIGAMIETPVAAISVAEIGEYADFLSIGTNDLLQYMMAAGRENRQVSHYYERGIASILKIIPEISAYGMKNSIEVYVCGELAGDVNRIEDLLHTGIRAVSISPKRVPALKNKIRSIRLRDFDMHSGRNKKE